MLHHLSNRTPAPESQAGTTGHTYYTFRQAEASTSHTIGATQLLATVSVPSTSQSDVQVDEVTLRGRARPPTSIDVQHDLCRDLGQTENKTVARTITEALVQSLHIVDSIRHEAETEPIVRLPLRIFKRDLLCRI
jgi:hypothetical protein